MSRLHTENHLVSRIGWLRAAVCGAKAGGANMLKATVRVTFWGALAMAITASIGALVGTAV